MKRKKNTRQLINCDTILDYGLKTSQGNVIAFFLLRPTNLAVLSDDAVRQRVRDLMAIEESVNEIEFLALNSRESFESNRQYLAKRIAAEEDPVLRDLIQADRKHLDRIQARTATAREFLLAVRLKDMNEREVYPFLNRLERRITENSIEAHRADADEIKTMLAVYFAQDVVSESFENSDGERWFHA